MIDRSNCLYPIFILALFANFCSALPSGVDEQKVNKATIDHFEKRIRDGNWIYLSYFDSRSPFDEYGNLIALANEEEARAWERYLFTAGDLHLSRVSDFREKSSIRTQAKDAEKAYLKYIEWYGSLKSSPASGDNLITSPSPEYPMGWLPEVRARGGQNDPPITRGRIRHVLSHLAESILTQDEPERVGEALKDYDPLWFGDDAIEKWIKSLGYQFSDKIPNSASNFEKILANADRPGWRELMANFVDKIGQIEAKRLEIGASAIDNDFALLRDQLKSEIQKNQH